MKQLIFTIYFWLAFIIVTLLGLIIFPLFLLICFVFSGWAIDSAIRWGIGIYGWVLVKVVPFLAPVKVESRTGELPFPAILVPNHNSAIDPYLFGALLTNVCFVTNWAFKIPIYGFFMRLARYVNTNEGWEKVCQQSAAVLQSGASLIIWPEGHRSRDGRLGRFKNGAFALAVKTGYPLLPVCILGSGKFLPPGKRSISPSLVKLILLDPIYPDIHNDPHQEIIRLRNTVQEVIRVTLQEAK
jgi:1-acyl-sn-glycerol-3-phosphate acyltransferase